MTRLPATALLPLALAAATVLLGACGDDSSIGAAETPTGGAASVETSSEPIELNQIPAGAALRPATYAMPLIGPDGPLRAVVEVPEGYFSAGGWVIDDGHGTLVPDEFGNLAFWSAVGQVDPDPCHDGPLERVGPGIRALADALEAQRSRITSSPQPVSLGGRDGLYVESRARGGFDGCAGGEHHLFRVEPGSSLWLADDIPGTTDRLWIVSVNGRRVVAAVQTVRGKTAHPAELIGIARSVVFDLGSYWTQPFRPGP